MVKVVPLLKVVTVVAEPSYSVVVSSVELVPSLYVVSVVEVPSSF